MEYSLNQANTLISNYLTRKNLEVAGDWATNWNSMFDLIANIGVDNNWDLPKTLHFMIKKFNEGGNSSSIGDIHKGVFNYLLEHTPGEMTASQIYTNNMDIAAYLGLSFKKGGKNDEFMGHEIKSSQSLRFHKDWNWIMGVAEIIRTTHEVSFSGTSCMIKEHGENIEPILTRIEQGEDTLTMAYRAIVAHARNFKMEVPTDEDNLEVPEENTEDIYVNNTEAIDPTPVEVKVDDLDLPYSNTENNSNVEGIEIDEDDIEPGAVAVDTDSDFIEDDDSSILSDDDFID